MRWSNANNDMREIILEGTEWKNEKDFYDAFFRSFDSSVSGQYDLEAVDRSISQAYAKGIVLPYIVRIKGITSMSDEARETVKQFCEFIKELQKKGYQVDVSCE
ncbi:MAG TPA: hypothetical protein VGL91_16575 [Acidobacteriota bacterium]